MKYKKIMLAFGVGAVSSIVLRMLQLFFVVETSTGFFIKELEGVGNIMLVGIFAIAFAVSLFAFSSHRAPENPPEPNLALSIASFLPAVSLLYQLLTESYPAAVRPWQISLLKITGILAVGFFVALGLSKFLNFKLSGMLFVLPTVHLIIRVICDFTAISTLALISDNLILMLCYCAVLWFMLQFAKLYNGVSKEKGFRSLLAGGILSVILCFTQAIPHIVLNLVTANGYMHTSFQVNLNLLFIGIFVLVFLLSHFSYNHYKNSCMN